MKRGAGGGRSVRVGLVFTKYIMSLLLLVVATAVVAVRCAVVVLFVLGGLGKRKGILPAHLAEMSLGGSHSPCTDGYQLIADTEEWGFPRRREAHLGTNGHQGRYARRKETDRRYPFLLPLSPQQRASSRAPANSQLRARCVRK